MQGLGQRFIDLWAYIIDFLFVVPFPNADVERFECTSPRWAFRPENFDLILVSFWVPLGSLLASLLGAFGRPNRP